MFSPQAWGCSGARHRQGCGREVFPTSVGMFRGQVPCDLAPNRFPHKRGDVPAVDGEALVALGFSPQAWGCSDREAVVEGELNVFPTSVGMFRDRTHFRIGKGRFPHERGDVPHLKNDLTN